MTGSLYEDLNVQQTDSVDTIKKQYRKLALQYHPDRGGDPEQFKKIQKAYEVLSDPKKRQYYDRYGKTEEESGPSGMHEDLFNLFRRGHQQRRQKRAKDTMIEIKLSLKDVLLGKQAKYSIERRVIDGDPIKCQKCGGTGKHIIESRMGPVIRRYEKPCDSCSSLGQTCKYKTEKSEIQFEIPKGCPDKFEVRKQGFGNEMPGCVTGDIIFCFSVQTTGDYKRNESDLYYTTNITLNEALFGFRKTIRYIDDTTFDVFSKSNLYEGHGVHFCAGYIPQKGLPLKGNPVGVGKLYILFNIMYPKESVLKCDYFNDVLSFGEDDAFLLEKMNVNELMLLERNYRYLMSETKRESRSQECVHQ